MKRILKIICFILLLTALNAEAGSIIVNVHIEETAQRTTRLDLCSYNPNGFQWLGRAEINETDSCYIFDSMPFYPILIGYIGRSGGLFAERLESPVDTLEMYVSRANLPRELDEIEVKAQTSYINDEKTVYLPSKSQKKTSSDAISLLQRMALAGLRVDSHSGMVTTASGEAISIFIDYLPASASDITNLRTMDVIRIELYDFPSDPRFNGAQHVVNFVMVRYNYGGYTKASARQYLNTSNGRYNLGSKFVYGRMTYDAAANFNFSKSAHNGYTESSHYNFPEGTIDKHSETATSTSRSRNGFGSFRAVYSKRNVIISNTIGLSVNKDPGSASTQQIRYIPSKVGFSETSATMLSGHSVRPAWDGNYQFVLPHKYTLIVTPKASFGSFKHNYTYLAQEADINNAVDEKAWEYALRATAQKQIGANSVSLTAVAESNAHNLTYKGTSPAKVTARYYGYGVRGSAQFVFGRLRIQPNAALYWTENSIGSDVFHYVLPNAFVPISFNINSRQNIYASYQVSKWALSAADMAPNIQYLNHLDAIKGNPALKPATYQSVMASYNYLINDWLSLNTSTTYSRLDKPSTYIFEPIANEVNQIMLRSYVNDGFLNSVQCGAALSASLLNRNLTLRGGVYYDVYHRTGIQAFHTDKVAFDLQANYIFNSFYISGSYQSSVRNCSSVAITDYPDSYSLGFGWGNGALNVSAEARNIFRSNHHNYSTYYSTTLFERHTSYSSALAARNFCINISYTISYGKRVNIGENLHQVDAVSTGMIK